MKAGLLASTYHSFSFSALGIVVSMRLSTSSIARSPIPTTRAPKACRYSGIAAVTRSSLPNQKKRIG
jgi:hypothetical protein